MTVKDPEKRREYMRAYYEKNKELAKAKALEHYYANLDFRKEQKREHYEANRDRVRAEQREYWAVNRERFMEKRRTPKTKVLAVERAAGRKKCCYCDEFKPFAEFHKNGRNADGLSSACCVCGARRAQERRRAMPPWADVDAIQRVYELAASWNSLWPEDPVQVDHIVPIRGALVSGLHVHNNLQILRAQENRAKSNRFSE